MTDTSDYSTTSAGSARIVFSGAYTPGTTGPRNLNLISTDRSLVVLLNNVFNNDRLSVTGGTSGAKYSPGGTNDVPVGWGWTCPAYGLADPVVTLNIVGNNTPRTLTVLAMPDEVLFGETWAPEAVELVTAGSNTPLGTVANPVVTEPAVEATATANSIGLAAAFAQLVPPPAAGLIRWVDVLSLANVTAGNICGFSLDGVNDHYTVNYQAGYPGISPKIPILSGAHGLDVHNHAGAIGNAYAIWHDETA